MKTKLLPTRASRVSRDQTWWKYNGEPIYIFDYVKLKATDRISAIDANKWLEVGFINSHGNPEVRGSRGTWKTFKYEDIAEIMGRGTPKKSAIEQELELCEQRIEFHKKSTQKAYDELMFHNERLTKLFEEKKRLRGE